MKLLFTFILFSVFVLRSLAQSYSFPHENKGDKFAFSGDSTRISVLFKSSYIKDIGTVYRKAFLNHTLQETSHVDYSFPSKTALISSWSTINHDIHAFQTGNGAIDVKFLICDHAGKIETEFELTQKELQSLFDLPFPKDTKLAFDVVPGVVESDITVLTPALATNRYWKYLGKTFACNLKTGKILWAAENKRAVIALKGMLVSREFDLGTLEKSSLRFINSQDGSLISEDHLSDDDGPRATSFLSASDTSLLMMGFQLSKTNSKGQQAKKDEYFPKFFLSTYELNKRSFDFVDKEEQMSSRFIHHLWAALTDDGNFTFVGEIWKSQYVPAHRREEQQISSLVIIKISLKEGKILDFYQYPVAEWSELSAAIPLGTGLLIKNLHEVVYLNANTPDIPPEHYLSIRDDDELVIAPFGPVVTKIDGKRLYMERLYAHTK